jgi:hypothetical protein
MAVMAIRGLARRFIPEMLRLGMTTTAGLNLLRGEGMGYRRTDFLADWRQFAGTERKRDPLRAIPKGYRPTEATIERTDYKQRKKFNYSYKVEGYDIITQADTETWITVASDDILTMEEAEEEAQRLADKYKLDIEIAKMVIDGVTVSKS